MCPPWNYISWVRDLPVGCQKLLRYSEYSQYEWLITLRIPLEKKKITLKNLLSMQMHVGKALTKSS